MTLDGCFPFEKKEGKKNHPRVLFRIRKPSLGEQPHFLLGTDVRDPNPPTASALATQQE